MTLNFNTKITVDLLDDFKLHSNNLHQFNIKWFLSVSIWQISEKKCRDTMHHPFFSVAREQKSNLHMLFCLQIQSLCEYNFWDFLNLTNSSSWK